MGKAALDLPDPLLAPPEGARTSTDELLSQLAGEEIDRLLAEADGVRPEGGPPVAASSPVHIAPPAVPEAEAPEEEPRAVFSAPPVAPAATPDPSTVDAPAAAAPTESELDVTAELDALFTAATAKDEEQAAAAAAAAARVSPAADPDAETGAEERAALTTVAAAASQSAGPVTEAEPAADAPLPFYLRPLEWLNAPLALLPPTVRDLVGKAAILTLLNAAAILAYVMFVRRG